MPPNAIVLSLILMAGCLAGPTPHAAASDPMSHVHATRPIVIAHRGASGERPEHTLSAYRLAIAQGADFIEPDLVPTRDGVLIARHENALSGTTDVAERPEFAARRTTKLVDGEPVTDWFAEDFSLAEIRQLRARERIPAVRPGNTAHDGAEGIPTLGEIIALIREAEAEGRRVGVYPETKHPTFFLHEGRHLDGSRIGMDTSAMLVDALLAEGFTDPGRVFIQSFELANLIALRRELMPARGLGLPLVLLTGSLAAPPHTAFSQPWDVRFHAGRGDDLAAIYGPLASHLDTDAGYAALLAPQALRALAEAGISGVGPWKDSILLRAPREPAPINPLAPRQRLSGEVHPMVRDARAVGLQVHPYTLRREAVFLAVDAEGEVVPMEEELRRLLAEGATGFFTDHPAQGRALLDQRDL